MAALQIHGGSFPPGYAQILPWGLGLKLPTGKLFGSQTIAPTQIASLQVVAEEAVKGIVGTLGWGALGAAALGPLGLVAGAVLGGRGARITFLARLHDGRELVASTDARAYAALLGRVSTAAQAAPAP